MTTESTRLYRYRSLAGDGLAYVERTISDQELYFAAPLRFNDPFDCRPVFSVRGTDSEISAYCERLVQKYMPYLNRDQRRTEVRAMLADPFRNPSCPKAMTNLQSLHTKRITEKIGVLCLSEVADDILMWAHYADAHQGICLIFDSSTEFFARAQAVNYPKLRPQINPIHDSEDEMLTKALLTKSDHWIYEKERRIIQYEKGPGTYNYPASALNGVILGIQISQQNEMLIRKWVGAKSTPANIYRALPCATEFRLKIELSEE